MTIDIMLLVAALLICGVILAAWLDLRFELMARFFAWRFRRTRSMRALRWFGITKH